MAWLDLVVTATVGRQSREAALEEKGCRAPPSSAGPTASPGAGSFSWETHGRICLNAF